MQIIYESLDWASRDKLPDLYERGRTIEELCEQFQYCRDTVRYTISSGYFNEGRIDEAEKLVRESLSERPCAEMHNHLLRCLLASPGDTRQEFYTESLRWAAAYEAPVLAPGRERFKFEGRGQGELRVGFLCDYTETVFGATSMFPMFDNLGRSGLKVSAYDFGRSSWEVSRSYEWHRGVKELGIDGLYQAIKSDGINILFDLNGRLRENNMYPVLFRRPAPIQINYFNLAATTGLSCIDYAIADEVAVPRGEERYFTETVYRMPGGANGAYSMPQSSVATMPCSLGNPFTFGSFNASFKLNERVLSAWARILNEAPGSRVIIKNADMARPRVLQRVVGFFAERGVQANRLILAGFTSVPAMYRMYGVVDLALDTFPYSGGSTTLHALWQGVPVLTVRGNDWRGRIATSILSSADLSQFIVDNVEDYIETAVRLAAQPTELSEVRSSMRERLQGCLYFNPDKFYVQLADACRDIWSQWLSSDSAIIEAGE